MQSRGNSKNNNKSAPVLFTRSLPFSPSLIRLCKFTKAGFFFFLLCLLPLRQVVFCAHKKGFKRILLRLKQLLRIVFSSRAKYWTIYIILMLTFAFLPQLFSLLLLLFLIFRLFVGTFDLRAWFLYDYYVLFFFMIIFSRLYITGGYYALVKKVRERDRLVAAIF